LALLCPHCQSAAYGPETVSTTEGTVRGMRCYCCGYAVLEPEHSHAPSLAVAAAYRIGSRSCDRLEDRHCAAVGCTNQLTLDELHHGRSYCPQHTVSGTDHTPRDRVYPRYIVRGSDGEG